MTPYLLRPAVAILRRQTPPSTFLRRSGRSPIDSSRFFASGGAVRVEPAKACCVAADLEKVAVNIRQMRETVEIMLEQEERFQRSEEFQKKLSYVLVPGAIAFFIFGPEKKEKASSEGQSYL